VNKVRAGLSAVEPGRGFALVAKDTRSSASQRPTDTPGADRTPRTISPAALAVLIPAASAGGRRGGARRARAANTQPIGWQSLHA